MSRPGAPDPRGRRAQYVPGRICLYSSLSLSAVKSGALADGDDLALVGLDLGDRLRDLGGDVVGDRDDAVLVAVDQVAGLDPARRRP